MEGSIPGWLQRAVAPNRLQNRHGVAATVAGRGACHLATPWKGTWKLSITCHDVFVQMCQVISECHGSSQSVALLNHWDYHWRSKARREQTAVTAVQSQQKAIEAIATEQKNQNDQQTTFQSQLRQVDSRRPTVGCHCEHTKASSSTLGKGVFLDILL
jgi:hypothetical protein